ncbi:MAG: J domain-containing protein [Candidatus Nanopelagicales bacterium]|nr:J domain-containing protein [Candidatus Nanopelagicales bacterium]
MSRRELWDQVDGDLYAILGVVPTATAEEIALAWRTAAKRSHPDLGGSIPDFQRIEIAYQVLSNPLERNRYDRVFAATAASPRQGAPGSAPPGHRANGPGSARAPGFSGSSWAPRSSQSPFASGNSVPDPYALPDTSWSTWQILLAVLAGIVGLVVLVLVFFASAGAVFVAIALVTLGIGSVLRRSRSRDGF